MPYFSAIDIKHQTTSDTWTPDYLIRFRSTEELDNQSRRDVGDVYKAGVHEFDLRHRIDKRFYFRRA